MFRDQGVQVFFSALVRIKLFGIVILYDERDVLMYPSYFRMAQWRRYWNIIPNWFSWVFQDKMRWKKLPWSESLNLTVFERNDLEDVKIWYFIKKKWKYLFSRKHFKKSYAIPLVSWQETGRFLILIRET